MSLYAHIALPLPVRNTFTYRIPKHLTKFANPGSRALVEVGNRIVVGVILSTADRTEYPDSRVKNLLEVLDPEPALTPDLIALSKWMSAYYHHPIGETFAAVAPSSRRATHRVAYSPLPKTTPPDHADPAAKLFGKIAARQTLPLASVARSELKALEGLLSGGKLERRWQTDLPTSFSQNWATLTDNAPPHQTLGGNSFKLAMLLRELEQGPKSVTDLKNRAIAPDTIKRAAGKNWITLEATPPAPKSSAELGYGGEPPKELTDRQSECVKEIADSVASGKFNSILLLGTTGSGKTEVYINAVTKALRLGHTALVLAPEITLTPQLVGRFGDRLGEGLAVLHSGLGERERSLQWEAVRSGRARVVVGTRSAIFAPLKRLGLIIVDEAHDQSYKQDEGLKYNAKHAALWLANKNGATVVLGSATPDVEDYAQATSGRYTLLTLPDRVGDAEEPEIKLVDIRNEERRLGRQVLIGEQLKKAITRCLEAGEQALVFHNRRGISPALYCTGCSEPMRCRHCSVALTLHKSRGGGKLVCHYCGATRPRPELCPECETGELVEVGAGTQKIEELISGLWPNARVSRLDRDSARGPGGGLEVLSDFADGKADILVGTQMVAKGHHFPKLTVAGVVSADDSLHLPDFRASERTYQTLSQVAGRTGRGESRGTVYIQTRNPHHPVLQAVAEGDYKKFATAELEEREEVGYPPYRRGAVIRIASINKSECAATASRVGAWLSSRGAKTGVDVLGPAPAPIERVRNSYRYQLLLRAPGPEPSALQSLIRAFISEGPFSPSKGVSVTIDIDPLRLM